MDNLVIRCTETPNLVELIQFIQGIEFISNNESYVKFLSNAAKHHILAYEEDVLLGWVALIEVNPATMFLFEWHPFVVNHPNKEKIQQKLLQEAIVVTKNANIPNLRTFVPVRKPNRDLFLTLEKLYMLSGMTKTHIQDCMVANFSKDDLKEVKLPSGMYLHNFADENKEDILNVYEQVFKDSYDDFVNSLDEKERKYWDLIGENQIPDLAVILKLNNNIVGFIGFQEEDGDYEIGPVGILPAYRGKKLSNVLMNHVIQKLLQTGKTEVYLEVGTRNKVAINLYNSYGFRKISEKHGFLIKV